MGCFPRVGTGRGARRRAKPRLADRAEPRGRPETPTSGQSSRREAGIVARGATKRRIANLSLACAPIPARLFHIYPRTRDETDPVSVCIRKDGVCRSNGGNTTCHEPDQPTPNPSPSRHPLTIPRAVPLRAPRPIPPRLPGPNDRTAPCSAFFWLLAETR